MSEFINEADKKIFDLYNQAADLATAEVERMARELLQKNPSVVSEFCMAMGSYSFYDSEGHILRENKCESLDGYKELRRFIQRWNDEFKITGEPMKFAADGPKITNW